MSVHDGLLSFQIKETIFLSSDRAGIEEVTELELLPDVEIIESAHDISITGCLQLFGKYKPTRNASTESEGGTDTLVSAMKFTPFQLEGEQPQDSPYETDLDLAHRIPLSISIPLQRVAQVEEIYAIVDGFDYEIKSSNHLQIEAELKISGIKLADENVPANENVEEVWEYVHVANEEVNPVYQTSSIDEIERKLAALEEEVEARIQQQERRWEQESYYPSTPNVYYPPQYETYTPQSYQEQYTTEVVNAAEANEPVEAVEQVKEEKEEEEEIQYLAVHVEPEEEVEAELVGNEETELAEEVFVAEEVPEVEVKEMKVAISTKAAKEKSEGVNLTSIFTHAGRPQNKQQESSSRGRDRESSSHAYERQYQNLESYKGSLDTVNNLSSFVSSNGEQFKKLKMCIIQRHDTLENIAQRYSLSVSRLLEVNALSSDRVEEGQVLYIPH